MKFIKRFIQFMEDIAFLRQNIMVDRTSAYFKKLIHATRRGDDLAIAVRLRAIETGEIVEVHSSTF